MHHVAFRAPDLETMAGWQQELRYRGVQVTEILDRQYFKSIYFREPGGVLFEIATDAPGFAIDEPLLELGRHLKLPPWLEPSREQIAASLPPLQLRRATSVSRERDAASTGRTSSSPRSPRPRAPPLLLLHGTGGDEHDLLPLRDHLSPGAAVLSVRGTVLENGMPRFFRRLREGVFDEDDLRRRADDLAAFVQTASAEYGIAERSLVAVGFSNGANIASALLLRRPGLLERGGAAVGDDPVRRSAGRRPERHGGRDLQRRPRPDDPGGHDGRAGRAVPGARRGGRRAAAPGGHQIDARLLPQIASIMTRPERPIP